jgi:hypothetical protein
VGFKFKAPSVDPVRVVLGLATGGMSEQGYFLKDRYQDATTPNTPTPELQGLPPSPTSANPTMKAKTEAALSDAEAKERRGRGRASTILTSGSGLLSSGLSLSRRTLIGY